VPKITEGVKVCAKENVLAIIDNIAGNRFAVRKAPAAEPWCAFDESNMHACESEFD
jgi:hypothetical protein